MTLNTNLDWDKLNAELRAERDALAAEVERLRERVADLEAAHERIATIQPALLDTLRGHGIVFDGPLGNDPSNWQHVAFSIYNRVCEADTIAVAALNTSNSHSNPSSDV